MARAACRQAGFLLFCVFSSFHAISIEFDTLEERFSQMHAQAAHLQS